MITPSDPHQGTLTVLFLDHTAKLGGGEIALLHLLQYIDRRRFHPVAVLGEEGPLVERLRESGIETHVLPLAKDVAETRKGSLGASSLLRSRAIGKTLAYCWRLARFIKSRRIDLIHTNSLKADLIGGVCSWLVRVPVVWHVRDRIDDDYLPRQVALIFRLLCRVMPDFVVANSAATLQTLHLPRTAQHTVIPSGCAVVHDGIRVGLEISAKNATEPPLIGLVGRIAPWKGQHIFIQAAAEVHKQFPECRFQIIGAPLFGEEDYQKELHDLAQSLAISDCIEFTGFQDDVASFIERLDILVHASITGEPFGQVVIEAMASGKPVVATNGGGIPEIVQHQITGLLVPMGDAKSMAAAILRLLANREQAVAMGAAGRRRVEEQFTIEGTVRKIEAVFDSLFSESADQAQHRRIPANTAA